MIFMILLAIWQSLLSPAYASDEGLLNKLLAPGPLFEGHKDLEGSDCLKCHVPGGGVPDSKCLECHKELQKPVASKTGFHGLTQKTCIECHSDHKGRTYDSTIFDTKTFDHKLTGYILEGKHADLKCTKCHIEKRFKSKKAMRPKEVRYFGLQVTCVSCHKKDDPHGFKGEFAKKDCRSCHGLKSWKEGLKFDHFRDGGFKLEGKHAKLDCKECHWKDKRKPSIYKWPHLEQKECLSCHTDQHKGHFGHKLSQASCTKCHDQNHWKLKSFDHRVTGYPLEGKHFKLNCVACHKQASPKIKISDKKFHFAGLKQDCKSCHKSPHLRTFSKENLAKACSDCHTETSWHEILKNGKKFDHDHGTRFPLTGDHRTLTCKACHGEGKKQVFKFDGFEKDFCVSCHQNVHTRQFKSQFSDQKCSTCHDTTDFRKRLDFDHNQTDFKLTGKHQDLTCNECHAATSARFNTKYKSHVRKFVFENASKDYCVECHKNVHIGQFHTSLTNKTCLECHTTDNFTKRKPFNHDETDYKLTGKHLEVKCSKCHVPTKTYFPGKQNHARALFLFPEIAAKSCQTCHKDPHRGELGSKCTECHNERGWKNTSDFHKNFTLSGIHFSLQCNECHTSGRRLGGMSENCVLCHQKDDVHNGRLPYCGECHRQQFWENAEFKHSMSNFPLRGIHRTLDCYSCHSNGVYKGSPSRCVDCHRSDALGFSGSPNHQLLLNQSCSECHNQFSFQ